MSSSNRFPLKSANSTVNPVTLPPGLAKIAATPEPSGSPVVNTMGIVRVAWDAARGTLVGCGYDDIDWEPDQIGCESGKTIRVSLRIAVFKSNVFPFDIPKIKQSLLKGL